MMVKNKRTNEILVTDDDGNSDLFVFHKKSALFCPINTLTKFSVFFPNIYIYIYVCVYVSMCMYVCIYTYMYAYMCIYVILYILLILIFCWFNQTCRVNKNKYLFQISLLATTGCLVWSVMQTMVLFKSMTDEPKSSPVLHLFLFLVA